MPIDTVAVATTIDDGHVLPACVYKLMC